MWTLIAHIMKAQSMQWRRTLRRRERRKKRANIRLQLSNNS